MGTGRVVGGDFLNGTVSTLVGSTLVVQAAFKMRKLNPENVAEWDEVVPDNKGNAVSAVSKAVAGAVLPGTLGKAASAAVGASLDSLGPSHVVRIAWADGKKSLIKLPDKMFKHLEIVLEDQRAAPAPIASDLARRGCPEPRREAHRYRAGVFARLRSPQGQTACSSQDGACR